MTGLPSPELSFENSENDCDSQKTFNGFDDDPTLTESQSQESDTSHQSNRSVYQDEELPNFFELYRDRAFSRARNDDSCEANILTTLADSSFPANLVDSLELCDRGTSVQSPQLDPCRSSFGTNNIGRISRGDLTKRPHSRYFRESPQSSAQRLADSIFGDGRATSASNYRKATMSSQSQDSQDSTTNHQTFTNFDDPLGTASSQDSRVPSLSGLRAFNSTLHKATASSQQSQKSVPVSSNTFASSAPREVASSSQGTQGPAPSEPNLFANMPGPKLSSQKSLDKVLAKRKFTRPKSRRGFGSDSGTAIPWESLKISGPASGIAPRSNSTATSGSTAPFGSTTSSTSTVIHPDCSLMDICSPPAQKKSQLTLTHESMDIDRTVKQSDFKGKEKKPNNNEQIDAGGFHGINYTSYTTCKIYTYERATKTRHMEDPILRKGTKRVLHSETGACDSPVTERRGLTATSFDTTTGIRKFPPSEYRKWSDAEMSNQWWVETQDKTIYYAVFTTERFCHQKIVGPWSSLAAMRTGILLYLEHFPTVTIEKRNVKLRDYFQGLLKGPFFNGWGTKWTLFNLPRADNLMTICDMVKESNEEVHTLLRDYPGTSQLWVWFVLTSGPRDVSGWPDLKMTEMKMRSQWIIRGAFTKREAANNYVDVILKEMSIPKSKIQTAWTKDGRVQGFVWDETRSHVGWATVEQKQKDSSSAQGLEKDE